MTVARCGYPGRVLSKAGKAFSKRASQATSFGSYDFRQLPPKRKSR